MNEPEAHGPIDYVLLEFAGAELRGEMAAALADLVEAGTIRLLDLVVIRKDADGSVAGLALDEVAGMVVFAGARSGLLGDDDIEEAGTAMELDTMAALIVYENAWAIPFVAAAMRAGGQLIASERIPALDVIAALDALEAAG